MDNQGIEATSTARLHWVVTFVDAVGPWWAVYEIPGVLTVYDARAGRFARTTSQWFLGRRQTMHRQPIAPCLSLLCRTSSGAESGGRLLGLIGQNRWSEGRVQSGARVPCKS